GLGALVLQQRVGADRRAVHDRRQRFHRPARGDPVEKAERLIAARRRHLVRAAGAGGFVEEEQIGERAADIDADDDIGLRAHSAALRRNADVWVSSIVPAGVTATPYSVLAASALT